jgi:hypothetical protein
LRCNFVACFREVLDRKGVARREFPKQFLQMRSAGCHVITGKRIQRKPIWHFWIKSEAKRMIPTGVARTPDVYPFAVEIAAQCNGDFP